MMWQKAAGLALCFLVIQAIGSSVNTDEEENNGAGGETGGGAGFSACPMHPFAPHFGQTACRQWTTHSQTSTQEMCVPMPTHICLYTCHTAGANDIPAMTELRKGQARQGQAMVEHGGALAQVALLCVHVHMCLRC